MATAAVLALGSVLLARAFLVSLNAYGYYQTSLEVTPWIEAKLWELQNSLVRSNSLSGVPLAGEFMHKGVRFEWEASASKADSQDKIFDLYRLRVSLAWKAGRGGQITNESYALYRYP